MFVVIRSGQSRRLFSLKPGTKSLLKRFFRYRFQQKVVHAQPKGMQGKIQLAAPDDARFGEQRPQMLNRIQPIYSRKGDYGISRRIFSCGFKERLLFAVAVHVRKHTALKAEL